MPTQRKVLFENKTLDKWQLSKAVLSDVIKRAEDKPITLEINNVKDKPFKIISRPRGPGGVAPVAWGVGGCGVDV